VTASDPGARRRSLTDDLLADLEQRVPVTGPRGIGAVSLRSLLVSLRRNRG
jgi:hypothetical protein